MLIHWIWLSTREGMGDHTRLALLNRFGDPETVYYAAKGEFESLENLSDQAKQSLQDKSLGECERILSRCGEERINLLTYQDAAYPARLKNIPDPPTVLYYKGALPDLGSQPVIGVVGTRSASAYGLQTAKRMGYQIAASGGILVSGMADGIDAMAMKGALTAGGSVVGVLGCGADVVYPLCNRALFADTERYGCIITEFPPGTAPLGKHFPRRNRIISGLGCGVLVVEAPEKSGALITARLAADQGRDVFAVPGNVDVESCAGSNALLRQGAIAVTSGWDVLSEYERSFPGKLRPRGQNARMTVYPDEQRVREKGEEAPPRQAPKPKKKQLPGADAGKISIDNGQNDAYIDLNKRLDALTGDEKTVAELLRGGQRLVDDVIAESGKSAGVVLAALTLLEVKGIVRRLPGRIIELAGK